MTHPAIVELLTWFDYDHLPAHLQSIVRPYQLLARRIMERGTHCAESTVALRKLLESKDAAVRAEVKRHRERQSEEEVAR